MWDVDTCFAWGADKDIDNLKENVGENIHICKSLSTTKMKLMYLPFKWNKRNFPNRKLVR